MSVENTAVELIPGLVREMRNSYQSQVTRSISFRVTQLEAFHQMMVQEEEAILQALKKDLKKILPVKNGIAKMLEHIDEYLKPKPVERGLPFLLDRVETRLVPLGTVLIMVPWNCRCCRLTLADPAQLALSPLVGAIAGGNTVVIKPSEIAPATAQCLATIIPKYLDPRVVKVINGGVPESTALLAEKWDLICYTGSTQIGRIVMQAAAKNLTPVLLELGGKSPVIIDDTVDPKIAAKRIIWGKLVNCGQTCIAPDYVVIDKKISKQFTESVKENIITLLETENAVNSPYYSRIISQNHFNRLSKLLNDQKMAAGSKLVYGGATKPEDLYIEPTIFKIDGTNHPIMEGEIFGPILPIIEVDSVEEAISVCNSVPGDPLSLHVFTKKTEVFEQVFASINAGHAVVNEVLMNAAVEDLPFGGVNESGLGSYHGVYSIKAFTREQGYFIRGISNDWLNIPKYQNVLGRKDSTVFKIVVMLFEEPLRSPLFRSAARVFRAVGGWHLVVVLLAFLFGFLLKTWIH
ncbi:Aldehyde dehydrogenase [Kappamyces sp. JEL0680]|nr:Aldehyde dehydrogenase [Kappamyces sp. JEL0680]